MSKTIPDEISFSDDVFDTRDVMARPEYIEDSEDDDEKAEAETLKSFLEDVKGCGGDEQWRGDWYPASLIRDSYFEEYAQEFAEDIGAIDKEWRWPATCIDWEKAARELQMDYPSVEVEGTTYWYR